MAMLNDDNFLFGHAGPERVDVSRRRLTSAERSLLKNIGNERAWALDRVAEKLGIDTHEAKDAPAGPTVMASVPAGPGFRSDIKFVAAPVYAPNDMVLVKVGFNKSYGNPTPEHILRFVSSKFQGYSPVGGQNTGHYLAIVLQKTAEPTVPDVVEPKSAEKELNAAIAQWDRDVQVIAELGGTQGLSARALTILDAVADKSREIDGVIYKLISTASDLSASKMFKDALLSVTAESSQILGAMKSGTDSPSAFEALGQKLYHALDRGTSVLAAVIEIKPEQTGKQAQQRLCNCENSHCMHMVEGHGCNNMAMDEYKILDLGPVCKMCYYSYPEMYRIQRELPEDDIDTDLDLESTIKEAQAGQAPMPDPEAQNPGSPSMNNSFGADQMKSPPTMGNPGFGAPQGDQAMPVSKDALPPGMPQEGLQEALDNLRKELDAVEKKVEEGDAIVHGQEVEPVESDTGSTPAPTTAALSATAAGYSSFWPDMPEKKPTPQEFMDYLKRRGIDITKLSQADRVRFDGIMKELSQASAGPAPRAEPKKRHPGADVKSDPKYEQMLGMAIEELTTKLNNGTITDAEKSELKDYLEEVKSTTKNNSDMYDYMDDLFNKELSMGVTDIPSYGIGGAPHGSTTESQNKNKSRNKRSRMKLSDALPPGIYAKLITPHSGDRRGPNWAALTPSELAQAKNLMESSNQEYQKKLRTVMNQGPNEDGPVSKPTKSAVDETAKDYYKQEYGTEYGTQLGKDAAATHKFKMPDVAKAGDDAVKVKPDKDNASDDAGHRPAHIKMRALDPEKHGAYTRLTIKWSANDDACDGKSPEGIKQAVISFVKGLESFKERGDLGFLGHVVVKEFDVEAGLAIVEFRTQKGGDAIPVVETVKR